MPPARPLFSRIARSIEGRMGKLAEDNPDGALAKYLWLWQSMGRQPGRRLIPRSIRFFFMASFDLFSLVGWYVRTRIRRAMGPLVKATSSQPGEYGELARHVQTGVDLSDTH